MNLGMWSTVKHVGKVVRELRDNSKLKTALAGAAILAPGTMAALTPVMMM